MAYNYLEKIMHPYRKSFNDTEKIIANHFIKLGDDVVNKTLSSLAKDTGLSEATIFKFVKKIGFEGFQNFKISVASNFRTMDERKNELIVFSNIDKEDSPYVIAQKVVNSNKFLLDNLMEMLDEDHLAQALELIYASTTLHFIGEGGSSVIALDGYHKFMRTKYRCNYIADYPMRLGYATKLRENDCAFLISHSGETKETIKVAEVLRSNGAKIITLTGNHYSKLVKLADVAFVVDSEESTFRSETLTSRILYLTIIDILYTATMYHDETENKNSLDKIREVLAITKTGGVEE